MNCTDIERLLSAHSLLELAPGQRAQMAAHMETCERCREIWGLDQESQTLHLAAEAIRPRTSIKDAVAARLGAQPPETGRREAPRPTEAPDRIGGFEILELLGRGGMGAVYKARQTALDRLVALKILPQALAGDASFVERFHREGRAAAAVSHPNIIEIYDVGEDRGYQYIAMELVDGETLWDVLRREGHLPAERVLKVMKQTASALAAAHAAGVLHRDIKPSNILLTAQGRVKVADFGLAKRTGVDVNITLAGQALGTPLYMAPEIARGRPLDARSDLYSFGATFYQALAGRPPFQGQTAAELVAQHLETQAPRLGGFAPNTPAALARIIHRLLRKDPAERSPSAEALLEALEAIEAGIDGSRAETPAAEPRAPSPLASEPRGAGQRRGRRTALIACLACVAALLVVLGVAAILTRDGPAPQPGPNGGRSPTTATQVPAPEAGPWSNLFDGRTLDGWRKVEKGCNVHAQDEQLIFEMKHMSTSIAWNRAFPRVDYEVSVEARRLEGNGAFCHIAFPVNATHCFLVVGGMGNIVALDQVDKLNMYGNETTTRMDFEQERWYTIRLRVTREHVVVWLDDRKVIDLSGAADRLSIPFAWQGLIPFGVGTWETKAAMRNIKLRRLSPKAGR